MTRYPLIPRPTRLAPTPGELVLDQTATLSCPGEAAGPGRLLRALISPATGIDLPSADPATLRLVADRSAGLGAEGYRLSVRPDGLLAVASSAAGLANCVQTVRQLLPAEVYRSGPVRGQRWALPCVEIEDVPRFSWRGALLDVARYFMPATFLFRFVDLLAAHKLNVLHLHLTDDQGWRFPSRAYPLLTERGSWRAETLIGHEGARRAGAAGFDGTPHGGYYTRQELTNLVAYALERNVTVVPEVDLPGHVQSVVAAYPELGCAPGPVDVSTTWGISEHVLNLSEKAMAFCTEVLGEVLEVFPSHFVHLGGDECPRTEWRADPAVQRRMSSLGLADEDALQAWFTGQVNDLLRSAGRQMVAWDEVLEAGPVPEDTVVMAWRHAEWGRVAAETGLGTIICPEAPCYFDHYQSDDPAEPLAIHGLNTLEDVYAFDPVPAGAPAEAFDRVLGTQLLLWTEYMPTPQHVEYMAFPRAAALAEVAWSAGMGEFGEFRSRLTAHIGRLDALSVNYRPLDGPRAWQRGGSGPWKAHFGPNGRPITHEHPSPRPAAGAGGGARLTTER